MTTALASTALDTHHVVTVSLLEAGRLLGMSRATTYRHTANGDFPVAVRDIAGRKRVRLIDLETYLDGTFS
jgi:predicted DNA-binding transcriptional regulator AlpA